MVQATRLRGLLLAILFILGAGAARADAPPPDSAIDPVLALIRAQTARMVHGTRTPETVPARAQAAQVAILRGDFAQAGAIAAAVLAESKVTPWHFQPFDDFLRRAVTIDNPQFRHRLDDWCDGARQDAMPLLLRARYELDLGWRRRQYRRLMESRDLMREAARDLAAAQSLNADIPSIYTLRLIAYPDSDNASDALQQPFRDALARFPGFYPAYDAHLWSLIPSMGGSVKAMYQFVEDTTAAAPKDSPLRLLYLRLYDDLLHTAADRCRDRTQDRDEARACVVAEMQGMTLPSLEPGVQAALALANTADRFDVMRALRPILIDMTAIPNANVNAGAVLELAAAALGSDNAISREDGQHGNYLLDLLTGDVWVRGGFPDNADAKYHHALDDVASNDFPTEADRDLAMADVYDRLANLAALASHFTEVISFMDAAYAYSGARGETAPYQECRAYYELKLYQPGLDACDAIVARGGGYGEIYWRGKLNMALTHDDDALRDFTTVADDLRDAWGTDAVISMSLIEGRRKDYQGMLDTFFKYPFVFRDCCETHRQLAVTYNNRCFAYMNLGKLEEALDDCTTSLRYGSLPDAFRKQQELVRLLKNKEKPGSQGPT